MTQNNKRAVAQFLSKYIKGKQNLNALRAVAPKLLWVAAKRAQNLKRDGKQNQNWNPNLNNYGNFNSVDITSYHSSDVTVAIAAANRKRLTTLSDIGSDGRSIAAARNGPGTMAKVDRNLYTVDMSSSDPFGVIILHAILENGETITASNSNLADFIGLIEAGLGAQSSIYRIIRGYKEAKYVPADTSYRLSHTLDLTKEYNQIIKDYDSKSIHEMSPAYIESFLVIAADGKAEQNITCKIRAVTNVRTVARPNMLLKL